MPEASYLASSSVDHAQTMLHFGKKRVFCEPFRSSTPHARLPIWRPSHIAHRFRFLESLPRSPKNRKARVGAREGLVNVCRVRKHDMDSGKHR
jgi:hypothetical protein